MKTACADALNHDWNVSAEAFEEATGDDIAMVAKFEKTSNNNKFPQHNWAVFFIEINMF